MTAEVKKFALNVNTFKPEILLMAGIDDPTYREYVFDKEGLMDLLEQVRSGADVIFE